MPPIFKPSRFHSDGVVEITGSLSISGSLVLNGVAVSNSLGSVVNTGSGVDNELVRFNGDGNHIQGSSVFIDDSQNITWNTDGVGDIGQTASGRPNNAYLSGALKLGSNITWNVDGVGNIGSATDNRPANMYLSGNLQAATNSLDIGAISATSSTVRGLTTLGNKTLGLYSQRTNLANNASIDMVANLQTPSIDANHKIVRIGYIDNTNKFNQLWFVKENEISSFVSGAAEMLGTDTDGGSAQGTKIGTDNAFTSSGAEIVSEYNSTVKRAYTDYKGQKIFGISDNGSYTGEYWQKDIISISSGSDAYPASKGLYASSIQFPAGALSYAATCRVLTNFQTSSNFSLGLSSSAGGYTAKWGSYIAGTANTTNLTSSMSSGWLYHATAQSLFLSSSVLQGPAVTTGSVRVEIRYRYVGGLTS